MKNFDLIIFGATGFTGRFVIERMVETVKKYNLPIKWAIAVRNKEKMKCYLDEMEPITGVVDLHRKISIYEADVNNFGSMTKAFGQSKLVLNCIGPYSLLGEPVVKACVESKSHYMDLSGEPLFLESMDLKYNQAARENGIYIVGSCGMDSIPSDIGTQYLKQKFNGQLNHVDHCLELWSHKDCKFSYATWISLIEGYKHGNYLKNIRKQLFDSSNEQYKQYKWNIKQKRNLFTKQSRGYIVPFPGSDRSVVKRTQLYRYALFNELPVQMEAYYAIPDLKQLLRMMMLNFNLKLFTKYQFTEKLLKEYGHIFSMGLFKKNVFPNRDHLRENKFRLSLIGHGWPTSIPQLSMNEANMTKRSALIINGGDGAYTETATIAVQTALNLLDQISKQEINRTIPCGVITPASIIECELLVSKLIQEGIQFNFIDNYTAE